MKRPISNAAAGAESRAEMLRGGHGTTRRNFERRAPGARVTPGTSPRDHAAGTEPRAGGLRVGPRGPRDARDVTSGLIVCVFTPPPERDLEEPAATVDLMRAVSSICEAPQ